MTAKQISLYILKGLGIGSIIFVSSFLSKQKSDLDWQHALLKEGYGEYNKKTGKWQMCEPEVVLLNRNTEAIKILNGGTVTINDYIKIIESDLAQSKERIDAQTKELVEQDGLLEKYKKNIKLPGESSSKNAKRPLEKFDPSVVVSKK